ncbi:MAG: putative ABC transporter permease [Ruminococcus bicirculans (ex Wegman et al. 2014)]|uniref:ABC transporter permease n=2 Tax=Ruminococcus bicirculans (ex Wegman et al. 2014) TaxID=1160721 RepID=A0AAW6EH68_9FIRM|nr:MULTISPECIES: putative ABC transporter permease [unclassified Ruminococcus]MCC2214796.1 putative ABC transporter permease [Hominimerdicola aceti]MDB8749047.1 putative ABC transporter permease [Ruminococcus bicirculans (ex Wegman et al. 2014)]MEE1552179.1 putative ABC transporter permease [Lachnospiraceae bacterium]MCB7525613.1 putative ABC transporter permease [Ruminococcus sp. TM463]MEE0836853.1 putative ABC transporter permease [Ruminococcus sp.]
MAAKMYKILTLFSVGAICYGFMEILNRGYSHITMGVLGGTSMLVIHIMNGERRRGVSLLSVLAVSAAFITAIEFLAGEYLNRYLGMGIWSYEEVPLNFDGQICLPFAFLWFGLSYIGVLADNFIRRHIFKEYPVIVKRGKEKIPAAVG